MGASVPSIDAHGKDWAGGWREGVIPLARPDLSGNEWFYVNEALKSGWISSKGPYVERFERDFAELFGREDRAVSCSSGTAALHLALLAAGIGRGDKVLVPDLTFAATVNVVLHVGAIPLLVDVGEDMCMDIIDMHRVLMANRDAKAVTIVHLYGNDPDTRLFDLANDHKLTVIEDMAECVQPSRVRGDYGCFSFYANKAITTGEGGMVVGRHIDGVRRYRDHGMVRPYWHPVPGLNYRLTNLQAAIGVAQLERLGEFTKKRMQNWWKLKAAIPEGQGEWLFVVPKKEMKTVETRPVFDPMHTMPYIQAGDNFPNSRRFHKGFMCLPCGPHLGGSDIEGIIREYRGESEEEAA